LLFNFALEYAIRRVQLNQDSLKLNGTHQLLVYAADVNILEGSVHTVQENAEALVVAGGKIGLEVNADKTKYMVMSTIYMICAVNDEKTFTSRIISINLWIICFAM
jgi:membrane protease subunit (stomatin/prohibitin family)